MKNKSTLICALVTCLLLSGLGVQTAQANPIRAVVPLVGEVSRPFDPPDQPWLAGHRGVDLVGYSGATVVAAMDGVVRFAGTVVDRPVISLDHGQMITSYEPVSSLVSAGDVVQAGQPIGVLVEGHGSPTEYACPSEACLHWGLIQAGTYLNPLSLLGGASVRLISAKDMESVRDKAARMMAGVQSGAISAAGLMWPVSGVVTDTYGQRLHPIEGVWRFHDGLDIGAACNTPLVATAAGTVVEAYYHASYGHRLTIDHGTVNGRRLTTSYNHALSYSVSSGQSVIQGQVIGQVGSTGASTGCHLHFQTWLNGQLVDPQTLLP